MLTFHWSKSALATACLTVAVLGCETNQAEKNGPIPPGPYTVTEGDDLSHIALRAYGDTELWYSLLNANPQLGKRPGFSLKVAETIIVPPQADIDRSLPKSVFPDKLPADYIVMPGDSLHFIADGCYGDRELWPIIYEANRHQLSERVKEDTRRLIAGQVLHIPASPGNEQKTEAEK